MTTRPVKLIALALVACLAPFESAELQQTRSAPPDAGTDVSQAEGESEEKDSPQAKVVRAIAAEAAGVLQPEHLGAARRDAIEGIYEERRYQSRWEHLDASGKFLEPLRAVMEKHGFPADSAPLRSARAVLEGREADGDDRFEQDVRRSAVFLHLALVLRKGALPVERNWEQWNRGDVPGGEQDRGERQELRSTLEAEFSEEESPAQLLQRFAPRNHVYGRFREDWREMKKETEQSSEKWVVLEPVIGGDVFFQKSFPNHLPDQVTQKKLADGTTIFYLRNTCGLISLAQFGAIEFHPWGSRMPHPEKPDQLIWDLDPDPAVPWPQVLGAAFLIRDFLAEQNLHALVKTSGGKGFHLVLFIKRTHDWSSMREFTKAVAREVAAFNPSRLVITSSREKRRGKIFIDWMRNGEGSTCIAPWSLRARDGASVSMPVNWSDLATATADGFTIHEPLKLPVEWIEPEPQLITKALLRSLTGKK